MIIVIKIINIEVGCGDIKKTCINIPNYNVNNNQNETKKLRELMVKLMNKNADIKK